MRKVKEIELDHVKYEIQSEVRRGGFANVLKLLNKMDNKFYALKILNKKFDNSEKQERFLIEVEFSISSDHPNIGHL